MNSVKKMTEEEKCCHGNTIGMNLAVIGDEMLEGSYSLKAKIQKERLYERKPFKEKKEVIGIFLKPT
jgi:hypothetical protein